MAKNKNKKPKKPDKPVPYNPLAPIAHPQTYAKQYAMSQFKPALSSLTKEASIKGAADAKAITDLTQALATHMAGISGKVQANYGQAQQSQAAVGEQLHNALSSSVQNVATGLAGKLSGMGAPAAASTAATGAVTQNAGGAANAGLAQDSAALSQLISQGASAKTYADTMPSYAAGLGAQNLANNQRTNNANLASQKASLTSQLPSMIADILNQTLQRNYQIASANRSAKQAATANAALNYYKAGSQNISQQNANANTTRARKAGAAKPKAPTYKQDANGYWIAIKGGNASYVRNAKGKKVKGAKPGSGGSSGGTSALDKLLGVGGS